MATILVVDDELGIRALLSDILADEGHTVELAENAAEARACRERLRPDLVLLDIWMPDVDGVTLLKEWGSAGLLSMPVIMLMLIAPGPLILNTRLAPSPLTVTKPALAGPTIFIGSVMRSSPVVNLID